MSIEHRHIEVFRAIMQAGSLTAAAGLLHTSQPTLSRELARLEYLLGFALFDRVSGRLRPTARALALFEEVQRSYIGLERVIATANSLREHGQGQLEIACQPAFSHALLPGASRRFLADRPGARVAIETQDSPLLEEWLSAQRFDLGLTESDTPPPGTRLAVLLAADEVCVLPEGHALLAKAVLEPADFESQAFVSLSPNDPYRIELDKVFALHGVTRALQLETQSAVSVCSLVREGLGLAIVNPLTALAFAGQGLALRRFSVSIPFRVSLARPEHRACHPLTEAFSEALAAETSAIREKLARLLSKETAS